MVRIMRFAWILGALGLAVLVFYLFLAPSGERTPEQTASESAENRSVDRDRRGGNSGEETEEVQGFDPGPAQGGPKPMPGRSAGAEGPAASTAGCGKPEGADFAVGYLGSKYFTSRELNDIGIEVDPTCVRYRHSLDLQLLQSGGPPPDGIPSVDGPRFESAAEAGSWMENDDLLLTVEREGVAKAYPLRILNWHEIVNDDIAGLPVTVTFCPLCNSGVAFVQPEIEGKRAEFGTSGRLYKSDLVMYDRVTGTFWSQIEGRPIVGPLVGRFGELRRIPANLTRWADWKEAHPEGKVLARPRTDWAMGGEPPRDTAGEAEPFPRDYETDPYQFYVRDEDNTFGTPFDDERLRAKAKVLAVTLGDQAKAYHKRAVERAGLLNDSVGGVPVLVLWDPEIGDVILFKRAVEGRADPLEFRWKNGELLDEETGSSWGFDGKARSGAAAQRGMELERLTGMTTFWFAWVAFHPETALYAGSPSQEESGGN